jgi:vacuolar-type H+-ATPase subunit F/Vma7
MSKPVFIGDELTASGFRLAGADVRVTDDVNVEGVFEDAAATANLILISARSANQLPPGKLNKALKALRPLLVVVPDASGTSPPDLTRHVRKTLDLE